MRRLLTIVAVGLFATTLPAEENWPRWRGPNQDGHAHEKGLPTEWSADDVAWKAPLQGWGQSSPVIWENRIFLTTALDDGAKRVVLAFDREKGEKLWEQVVWTGPAEKTHAMNGWASATQVTDGEHVYSFFGKGGGLFCHSMDGKLVWNAGNDRLGEFEGPWGTAACPVLVGDLVIQNCDADSNSFIAAFDKKTGAEEWRVERPQTRGWSTPILLHVEGRDELILNGHEGPVAYDPTTGEKLWWAKDVRGRGTPTATPLPDGRIACLSGRQGGYVYAVQTGGSGEKERLWSELRSGGRDLASPIVLGNRMLIVNMKGVLYCYDTADGSEVYKDRIKGEYAATPVAWDGKAFLVNLEGKTVVVEPGDTLKVVGTNDVGAGRGEIFRASVTPSDGQVFLRSDKFLYCVGKRN